MVSQVFATKRHMTQAWTSTGKRVAVTCLHMVPNMVVAERQLPDSQNKRLEIGYGLKKLANMTKPLRTKLERGGFHFGAEAFRELEVPVTDDVKVGTSFTIEQILTVGDIVNIQGVSKGRGFAGAIKRHGFSGGPKTHGQSDRWRAVGAIGQRTTPGRVFRGKRMPGHYGVETLTVEGLTVLHIDPTKQEVWVSGPIPGAMNSLVTVKKTGKTKTVDLDKKASGIVEVAAPVAATPAEAAPEVTEKAQA